MFRFGKEKKQKSDKAPPWFMWLMGGFLVYALATNIFTDKPAELREEKAARSEGERINFAVVKGLSAGGAPLPLYAYEVKEGRGVETAGCWYTVEVRYRLYNGLGKLVEEIDEEAPAKRFTIGKRQEILALERGVMGMRRGGERVITARPELAYGMTGFSHDTLSANDYVGYVLTLEKMERPPALPQLELGLRIYDDVVGDGLLPAQCTDTVQIRIRAFDLQGREIQAHGYDMPLYVHLGKGQVPYAVERAVMGMKPGGKRTVIAPSVYMQPLFGMEEVEESVDVTATPEQSLTSEEAKHKTPPLSYAEIWQTLMPQEDEAVILEIEYPSAKPRRNPQPK